MLSAFLLVIAAIGALFGIACLYIGRLFVPGDRHVLDGVVRAPLEEDLVFLNASVWDGCNSPVLPGRCVVVRQGRISEIVEASATRTPPPGCRVIDAAGKTLLPGLIDGHVHLMYDSGPDLLTRAPKLAAEWVATIREYPAARDPIVRRGQLKLKAGGTTMRVLGDGHYSLAYRDDLARWDVTGPRVLTAGVHVNGPAGYVSAGLAAHLDSRGRAEAVLELTNFNEIEEKINRHIDRGVDLIKIATTHGDMGFRDARPDLPEGWVREIVRVARARGLTVTAHSYGDEGDWAAIRGGVDGIEHLVNVPHQLSDEMVEEIGARGIYVCPTLSGSSYSVMKFLRAPELLHTDPGLVANVPADVRRDLYLTLRLLKLPGMARLLLHQKEPMRQWESWYRHSLANTRKLHAAGVRLLFGTDTPFAFGNFHHSVMNEMKALQLAGLPNESILGMATSGAAAILRLDDRIGTIEPGKVADLLLVAGDPVADLAALENVVAVTKAGRLVFSGTELSN